jgi:hypothetical protein
LYCFRKDLSVEDKDKKKKQASERRDERRERRGRTREGVSESAIQQANRS